MRSTRCTAEQPSGGGRTTRSGSARGAEAKRTTGDRSAQQQRPESHNRRGTMRATSDQLLRLLSTMTAQEKRYFKLSASFYDKKSSNHCLRLFELIERRKPDNSREIAAIAEHETYAGQLAYVKNQLTEQVLDSLASYTADKRSATTLYRLIAHADILTERGLYQHANKVLERARKKAEATDQYLILLELITRERTLLFRHVTQSFETELQALYTRQQQLVEMLQLINKYRELADTMQITAARYAAIPTTADKERMRAIVATIDTESSSDPLPFTAQMNAHSIHGTYALLTGAAEAARERFRRAVQLWQQHPAMIEEYPVKYLGYLQNYLNSLVDSNDSTEFSAVAAELRSRAEATPETEFKFLKELWNLELLFYLNRGDVSSCATAIADIERCLRIYSDRIEPSSSMTLYHNCSVYYFLAGRYTQCLDYINSILGETRVELKRDLLGFARVFSLIAHFELGNTDVIETQRRSARHYLKKLGADGALEQIVLKSMGLLIDSSSTADERAIFGEMRKSITALLHHHSQEPPGIVEVLFWVESRLQRKPIASVFSSMIQHSGTADSRTLFPLQE